jgi:hypothetical protein
MWNDISTLNGQSVPHEYIDMSLMADVDVQHKSVGSVSWHPLRSEYIAVTHGSQVHAFTV